MAKEKVEAAPVDESDLDAGIAPVEVAPEAAPAPEIAPEIIAIPDSSREKRWKEFLVAAEAQAVKNGTKAIFDADEARGAFKSIPDSFA